MFSDNKYKQEFEINYKKIISKFSKKNYKRLKTNVLINYNNKIVNKKIYFNLF